MPILDIRKSEPCQAFSLAMNMVYWKGIVHMEITDEKVERYLTSHILSRASSNRWGGKISEDVFAYMDVVTGLFFNSETGVCTKSSRIILDLKTLVNDNTSKANIVRMLRGADALVEEEE